MNVKLLKKLSKRIRFIERIVDNKKEYVVERKSRYSNEWELGGRSIRIERALIKKHIAWHMELYMLNITPRLLERRRKRSKK